MPLDPDLKQNMLTVGGGAANEVEPDATGLNPAWRKDALVVWGIIGDWPSSLPQEVVQEVKSNITRLTQELGDVAGLDHAGYLNEADPYVRVFTYEAFSANSLKFLATSLNGSRHSSDRIILDCLKLRNRLTQVGCSVATDALGRPRL